MIQLLHENKKKIQQHEKKKIQQAMMMRMVQCLFCLFSLYQQSIFYFIYATPGFTFSDVYYMPVHLKNFYLRELMELKKKEKQEIDKSQSRNKSTPTIPRRFNPKK